MGKRHSSFILQETLDSKRCFLFALLNLHLCVNGSVETSLNKSEQDRTRPTKNDFLSSQRKLCHLGKLIKFLECSIQRLLVRIKFEIGDGKRVNSRKRVL